jgi:hypothetical protein
MKTWICVMAASAALAVLPLGVAAAATPARCDVRLSLHLTPDAADPSDQGFLDSLLADPLYRLAWIRGTDTKVLVELTGPATDRRCRDGIRRLSASAFVLDVKVIRKGT